MPNYLLFLCKLDAYDGRPFFFFVNLQRSYMVLKMLGQGIQEVCLGGLVVQTALIILVIFIFILL